MTDWIDALANSLHDDEKAENLKHRIQLVHADIIRGRGPQFFDECIGAIEALAREIDEKLGATLSKVRLGPVVGGEGRRLRVGAVEVAIRLNQNAQQIDVTIKPANQDEPAQSGQLRRFVFKVDEDGQLLAKEGTTVYQYPAEMASDLLKSIVTPDLLRRS